MLTKVTIELDAMCLASVQSALTLAAIHGQHTLAMITAQVNAQMAADAVLKSNEMPL